ncbi:MAG TPA: hypothetical protein VF412_05935 [Bdellovibrio sp.]|uniref:hypothetical protein n=1 Tax=Bdellovibrio sp. TaxID=28201 RepID=UPI002EF6C394
MKTIISCLLLCVSVNAWSMDEQVIHQKSLVMAKSLYHLNISEDKNAVFKVTRMSCAGEDGTQICDVTVGVREKDATAGVESYKMTFMNDQLQKVEQSCKYCW